MVIGTQDAHLVGKLLERMTRGDLVAVGLTGREIVRAETFFEELDEHLTMHVGPWWDCEEVQ